MSHDIIAGPLTDAQIKKISSALRPPSTHDDGETAHVAFTVEQFQNRFKDCSPETFAAKMRRAAGDPLNELIYWLLKVPGFYGTISGNEGVRTFTQEEICEGIVAHAEFTSDLLADDSNDDLPEELSSLKKHVEEGDIMRAKKTTATLAEHPRLGIELNFLFEVHSWMRVNDEDAVRIYFG